MWIDKIFERYPFSGAGVTLAGTIPSFINELNSVLQFCSLTITIVLGLIAISVHMEKRKNKKNDSQK